MPAEFVASFKLDSSDYSVKIQAILSDLDNLKRGLQSVEGNDKGSKKIQQLAKDYKYYTNVVNEQRRAIERLEATRSRGITNAAGKFKIPDKATSDVAGGSSFTAAGLDKAIASAKVELKDYVTIQDLAKKSMEAMASKAGPAWDVTIEKIRQTSAELQRMQQYLKSAESQLRTGIANAVDSEIAKIDDQIRQIESAVSKQGSQNRQKELERVTGLERKANAARERAISLNKQLQASNATAADKAARGVSRTEEEIVQHNKLKKLRDAALHDESAARRQASRPQELARKDQEQAGVTAALDELRARKEILNIRGEQARTPGADFIESTSSEIGRELSLIKQRSQAILEGTASEKERAELQQKNLESQRKIARLSKESSKNVGQGAFTEQRMQQEVARLRPGIDRLFGNVFEDMGRRFTATLQFAISGAIIFGAQKLVKEFIQAAIEVERAFADIESALEFDIDAERGTNKFNLQVESVRQRILMLADEFNVLPTEANKAAFVMVSRFKDVDNAMIALRSHLLATKVSTIDQSEVLRALTATAEGFAAAIFDSAGSLDLNERLLRREAISARLYGQALDLAVQIQQKFGVEVEDTLEGGARSTEVFRQMGFTMEETFAIVAATSRELGQTGQQVAERLNRSLGQLTDPKVRDALLDLAGASSEFNLQISDFDSGANAWKKIVDQFERLEKLDPDAARKILQIVGQRRELEAVAAALGTTDLQKSITAGAGDAAGSAEARFAFLSRTITEILASMTTGFQELAQNFERLGGISSLKLLLIGIESILTVLNKMVDLLLFLRDTLNSFSPVPFGSILSNTVLFGVALATTLRTAIALKDTFQSLTTTKISSIAANFFSGGIGSARVNAKMAALNARVATGRGAGLMAGAASYGTSIRSGAKSGASSIASYAAANPILLMAVAAGVAALSLKSLYDRTKALELSFKSGAANIRAATVDARRQILDEGLSGNEAREVILQSQKQAIEGIIGGAPSGKPGVLDYIGGSVLDAGTLMTLRKPTVPGLVGSTISPENDKGSKEYWQTVLEGVTEEYYGIQAKGMLESIANMPEPTGTLDADTARAIASAAGTGFAGTGVGGDNKNPLQLAQEAMNERVREGIALMEDDSGSQDDRNVRIIEASTIFAEAANTMNHVIAAYREFVNDSVRSVNQLTDALNHLDIDIALGRQTRQSSASEALKIAAEYRERSEEFAANGDSEEAKRVMALSEATIVQAMQMQLDNARKAAASSTIYADQEAQIVADIGVLRLQIERATDKGRGTEALEEELQQAVLQLKNIRRAAATAAKQHSISMARSFKEKNAATRAYIKELQRQATSAALDDNAQLAKELQRTAELAEKQRIDDAREEAIRADAARIKLAGPALSSSQKIIADISGAKARLANAKADGDSTRIAEALQSIRELLAQQAQQELERLTVLTLAKVSVRDALSTQLVQLSALKNEARLAADIFGKSSTEYMQAARSIKEAEVALQDLALDLESTNRQLATGFDVTSSLDSATEDYIRIARQLQIPDLGEVEKASLELELKNAAAAQVAAQFSDAMLNLQFDFERGDLGMNAYISSLQNMLAEVDTSTEAGKKLWMQINGLIESLTGDINTAAFNIPGQIRLPTLFEVRRAVQAEALGVNYLDNRQQNIQVYVSDNVEVDAVFDAINNAFDTEDARNAPGGAGITIGGF